MFRIVLLCLCFCLAPIGLHAQQSNMSSLPASLLVGGELVDVANGFKINIKQTGMEWQVGGLGPPFTKYVGINRSTRLIYTVFVDGRLYAEETQQRAADYATGLKVGLTKQGWTVGGTSYSSSDIPRKRSFRFVNEAVLPNGVQATFIEYVTSPGKLYTIGAVLPAGVSEADFKIFVKSFRLIE